MAVQAALAIGTKCTASFPQSGSSVRISTSKCDWPVLALKLETTDRKGSKFPRRRVASLFNLPHRISSTFVSRNPLLAPFTNPQDYATRNYTTATPQAVASVNTRSGVTDKAAVERHNELQQEHYDRDYAAYIQEVPQKTTECLQRIVQAANLKPGYRVLDCGCGAGRLIPHLLAAGVEDITAVDLSLMMIALVKEQFDHVLCWMGDVLELPPSFGPFDTIFMNEVLEGVHSQEAVLKAVADLLRPGGSIIVSHTQGRSVAEFNGNKNPELQPHTLPDPEGLKALSTGAGLILESCEDNADMYLAVLKKESGELEAATEQRTEDSMPDPEKDDPYYFAKAPLYMKTPVVSGFGRGSRQLGFPTANLDPEMLVEQLEGLMNGVYFGWARLVAAGKDDRVYKMVMNVGNRPTFADGAGQTIEVHVLNKYESDFYGDEMRIVVLGCIRPEQKFSSAADLVKRITEDADIAQVALEEESKQGYKRDPFLLQ